MIEPLTMIEIAEKIYKAGKWIIKNNKKWNLHTKALSQKNIGDIFGCEYFKLSPKPSLWREFKYGKESFRESNRLSHDENILLKYYHNVSDKLLKDRRIGVAPYEILQIDYKLSTFSDTTKKYEIPSNLRGLLKDTSDNLIDHCKRQNIQYVPLSIAGVCNIDKEKTNVTLESVNYSDVTATNLSVDLDINKIFNKSILCIDGTYPKSIREYDINNSKLNGIYPDFNNSILANPIGVAGIGITVDNKMVISQRSRSVSTYAGMFGPSASGYVAWKDVEQIGNKRLKELLEIALLREISEELHLDTTCDISYLHALGLFREFYRGGMPQGFFLFKINLTSDELVDRILSSRNFPEYMGILFIPINSSILIDTVKILTSSKNIKKSTIGLELKGLLLAVSNYGENIVNDIVK